MQNQTPIFIHATFEGNNEHPTFTAFIPRIASPNASSNLIPIIHMDLGFLLGLNQVNGGKENGPNNHNELIENLPLYMWSKEFQEASNNSTLDCCTICLDKFTKFDQVVGLPCGHFYHRGCVTEWLHGNGACPICRKECLSQEYQPNNKNNTDEISIPHGMGMEVIMDKEVNKLIEAEYQLLNEEHEMEEIMDIEASNLMESLSNS